MIHLFRYVKLHFIAFTFSHLLFASFMQFSSLFGLNYFSFDFFSSRYSRKLEIWDLLFAPHPPHPTPSFSSSSSTSFSAAATIASFFIRGLPHYFISCDKMTSDYSGEILNTVPDRWDLTSYVTPLCDGWRLHIFYFSLCVLHFEKLFATCTDSFVFFPFVTFICFYPKPLRESNEQEENLNL